MISGGFDGVPGVQVAGPAECQSLLARRAAVFPEVMDEDDGELALTLERP